MTKLEALKALAEKVEAGGDASPFALLSDDELVMFGQSFIDAAQRAYRGSLDAAKALNEAVLPGWVFWDKSHTTFGYEVALTNGDLDARGCSKVSEARAWLLAILKALIAQEAIQDLADADRDII